MISSIMINPAFTYYARVPTHMTVLLQIQRTATHDFQIHMFYRQQGNWTTKVWSGSTESPVQGEGRFVERFRYNWASQPIELVGPYSSWQAESGVWADIYDYDGPPLDYFLEWYGGDDDVWEGASEPITEITGLPSLPHTVDLEPGNCWYATPIASTSGFNKSPQLEWQEPNGPVLGGSLPPSEEMGWRSATEVTISLKGMGLIENGNRGADSPPLWQIDGSTVPPCYGYDTELPIVFDIDRGLISANGMYPSIFHELTIPISNITWKWGNHTFKVIAASLYQQPQPTTSKEIPPPGDMWLLAERVTEGT